MILSTLRVIRHLIYETLFDRTNITGAIDVKMDGFVLEEKSSFKMLGLTFSSKLNWGPYIISIAKTASKKFVALTRSMKFLSPVVAPVVDPSGLVPLAVTWNC